MSLENELEMLRAKVLGLEEELQRNRQKNEELWQENEALRHSAAEYEATIYQDEVTIAQLRESSTHDFLTGLLNRRGMWEHLNPMLSRLALPGKERSDNMLHSLSLLFLDVDFFKRINDTYGLDIGDKVLKRIGGGLDNGLVFGHRLREEDRVVRWGGEEFCVLLPGTNTEQFQKIMRDPVTGRMRSLELNFSEGEIELRITLSGGFAEHHPEDDFQNTILRAQAALKAAKKTGRNKVVIAI